MNALHLFRRDLRIHDNTALSAMMTTLASTDSNNELMNNAASQAYAVFVITPKQWLEHDMALVQVDLILRTLAILADSLYRQLGIHLSVLIATDFAHSVEVICQFCQQHDINQVFANHEYELNERHRDELLSTRLANRLAPQRVAFNCYHDQCILPPNSVQNNDGQMYRVFTPFYKKWSRQLEISVPDSHTLAFRQQTQESKQGQDQQQHQKNLEQIQALCTQVLSEYKSAWQTKVSLTFPFSTQQIEQLLTNAQQSFIAGEVSACHRLDQFIAEDIYDYDVARDLPSQNTTSRLSPYLAIGSLSPRLCFLQARKAIKQNLDKVGDDIATATDNKDVRRWISELAWRDFYRHVLVARPDLIKHQAYLVDTDSKVGWSYDRDEFAKWCEGRTGVPLVDSAMRCLNATGFMHNRLRMVVAMFLTKDLLIDWRWGERYFMQMLIDADFASNNGGWQWSASTGTDAAPYFRIMNPFSQGKTHDPEARFIKTWLPELTDVPPKILHDEQKLRGFLQADLLVDYPLPMVDHKLARLKAIEAFKTK